jgi:hypothetical protein
MRASIGGAFYPTGYSMVMFPSAEDADRIGHRLIEKGMSGDEVYLLPADTVLARDLAHREDSDNPLPSAGTDAATVRAYTKLAREGHTGLLVKTKDEAAEPADGTGAYRALLHRAALPHAGHRRPLKRRSPAGGASSRHGHRHRALHHVARHGLGQFMLAEEHGDRVSCVSSWLPARCGCGSRSGSPG